MHKKLPIKSAKPIIPVHHIFRQKAPKNRCADKTLCTSWCMSFNLAIRGHVDNLPDSSLIQKRVAKVEWRLFASPRYVDEFGEPATPDDLKDHCGLCLGWRNDVGQWKLHTNHGDSKLIQFIPRLSSDDMVTLKEACAAGLGIVSLPAYVCENDVKIGRLVGLLPDWLSGEATLSLLQPSRRGTPPAVNAFAEHITRRLPELISMK